VKRLESSYTARVVSIRLTDRDRATIDAAVLLTHEHRGPYYGYRTESRSEFIVKAALQRATLMVDQGARNTKLERTRNTKLEDGRKGRAK
jgi:uncharacterized protein (DUF1778 family)